MPASRNRRSTSMKQSTLPFLTSRSSSTANATSKTKPQLARATTDEIESTSSSSSDEDEIEFVESDDAEVKTPTVTQRKEPVATKKKVGQASPAVAVSLKEKPELHARDKRWNKVWNDARARNNNLQPVHGEDETKFHQILRVFDMSYEYGPCVGVSRLERWERASALGLNPPIEIRDILLTRNGIEDPTLAENVLHGFQV
ncbi:hypothetical protein D9758_008004 [Tetrapyrgos nigripes]|uniref:DNA polymerase delta subunit 4 n=1 Tax=Tetrapyrgos nigripes TaxID=182062 RepID=A0A8H5FVJ1_9AGAR|nr:hypothetical protein D9758_008004 [Tetrapyrgos nigripes]